MDMQRQSRRPGGVGGQGMHTGRPAPIHFASSGNGKENGRSSDGVDGGRSEEAVSEIKCLQLRQGISYAGESGRVERAVGTGGIAEKRQAVGTSAGIGK